jgi:hypothetical protein
MKAFYQNMVTKLFWPDADEQSLGVMSRVWMWHTGLTASAQQPWAFKAYGVEYNGRLYVIKPSNDGGGIIAGELSTEWGGYNLNPETWIVDPTPDNDAFWYNDEQSRIIFSNPTIMNHFIEHMVGQM